MKDYTADFREKDGFLYKRYHINGAKPALYISPIKNRFGKKNCLSLTVNETDLEDDQINKILDNVSLQTIPLEK